MIIYPNPVTDNEFTVKTSFSLSKPSRLYVFNMEGKLLHSSTVEENTFTISTQNFHSPGIYIVNLITDKNSVQKKLVIQ
jgi:hypothetical protein